LMKFSSARNSETASHLNYRRSFTTAQDNSA
jgi:hypothetical protein